MTLQMPQANYALCKYNVVLYFIHVQDFILAISGWSLPRYTCNLCVKCLAYWQKGMGGGVTQWRLIIVPLWLYHSIPPPIYLNTTWYMYMKLLFCWKYMSQELYEDIKYVMILKENNCWDWYPTTQFKTFLGMTFRQTVSPILIKCMLRWNWYCPFLR